MSEADDLAWQRERVRHLRARSQPDPRFQRDADEHSAYRYRAGLCRCPICHELQLAYKREWRARRG